MQGEPKKLCWFYLFSQDHCYQAVAWERETILIYWVVTFQHIHLQWTSALLNVFSSNLVLKQC
jgi:hypothetical protein